MDSIIYKICSADSWGEAEATGRFHGSADDRRDGFIHFSTAGQLAETAARHFAGQLHLVLVAVAVVDLGPALKWEPARDGALFPHLYAPLPVAAALWVRSLPLGPDGVHRFPPEVAP